MCIAIYDTDTLKDVTILILIDGFLQYEPSKTTDTYDDVTILILIDGFLQLKNLRWKKWKTMSQSLF